MIEAGLALGRFLLGLAGLLLVGYGGLALLTPALRDFSWGERLSFSFGLGALALTWWMLVLSSLGRPFSLPLVLGPLMVLPGAAFLRIKILGGGGQGSRTHLQSSPIPPPPTPYRGLGGEFEGRAGELRSPGPPLKIILGQSYQTLAAAHLAVVASGTATLEAALAGTPTIIVYRLAPLSYELGRRLIKVDHIGMANLLAGERLFPEILQEEFTPARLAQEVISLIQNPQGLAALKLGLGRIINNLGGPGASARAARIAVELMQGENDDQKNQDFIRN
ncbi:MAG: hypothetical protein AB1491_13080 [Thermodesulfobacteriota bacterium]